VHFAGRTSRTSGQSHDGHSPSELISPLWDPLAWKYDDASIEIESLKGLCARHRREEGPRNSFVAHDPAASGGQSERKIKN
jgi:hypothetical protein